MMIKRKVCLYLTISYKLTVFGLPVNLSLLEYLNLAKRKVVMD